MDILRAILQEVADGTTAFKPKNSSNQGMQNFQPIAKVLAYADRQGFLESFIPHKESSTGNRWYDLVMVPSGLPYEGEQFLFSAASGSEPSLEQIIQLKPSIYGVGVDLWALWRKCKMRLNKSLQPTVIPRRWLKVADLRRWPSHPTP